MRRTLLWLIPLSLLVFSIYYVYRWAEPNPDDLRRALEPVVKKKAYLRLENAPFSASVENRKTWEVFAQKIEVEQMPGASVSDLQSATLTGIKDGKLYDLPRELTGDKSEPKNVTEKVEAVFRADAGRYAVNDTDPLPAELAMLYRAKWQLKLSGNVQIKTALGDALDAPVLTVLELERARDRKIERRILCPEGAALTIGRKNGKTARLKANLIRFNPDERTVEALKGVAAVLSEGTAQTEHVYYDLKQEILLLPENSSGTLDGIEFIAQNLVIDLKHGTRRTKHARLQISEDRIASP